MVANAEVHGSVVLSRRIYHWIGNFWGKRTFCGLSAQVSDPPRWVVFAGTGKAENRAQLKRVTCKNCLRVLGTT